MDIMDSDNDKMANKNPGKDLDHFFEPPKVPTGSDKKVRRLCKLCRLGKGSS
ncbi:hypothetical protein C0991_012141 [Blastosporella zonata]|nr:hypothetical protein C0991_012141 [Blastosporella zonata]